MIRNRSRLDELEQSLIGQEEPDYRRNVTIVEALYREACHLGVFPLNDPLDGIEVDIRVAKALNVPIPD